MDTVKQNGERISKEQRSLRSLRYKRITKAINTEFWDSTSETDHSFYVGSYGRGGDSYNHQRHRYACGTT